MINLFKKILIFLNKHLDKFTHAYAGTLIAAVFMIGSYGAYTATIMLVIIIAIIKEVLDEKMGGVGNKMDALATVIGGIIGILLIMWRG